MKKPDKPSTLILRCILYFLLIVTTSAVNAQDPAQYGTPFNGVPNASDAIIYQVNMRAFSSTRNLQGVTNRLDNIKALGTNVIYLMPVFPVGTDSKSVNSPYCIKDFNSIGTEFGNLTNLRNVVDGAHSRGMAVIMDWVVNQTSWDHPWISQHPDWYIRDANGNIQATLYPDVASLDFNNTNMRAAMIAAMRSWVFNANIDGFRCDFADNPPTDFWQQAISSLRGITSHKLLMLAEGTKQSNYTAGFDLNFGMQFYKYSLKTIFTGQTVNAIDNSNYAEYLGANAGQQVARYLTNHDVNGSDGTPLQLFGGTAGSMAAFVAVAYMKGVPFIYNGQEVAFPTQIKFPFTTTVIDWTINPSVTSEYTKVLRFRNNSVAVRQGTLTSYDNADVCAFSKISGNEKIVVLSNLRNNVQNFSLPSDLINTTWKDAYTGATVTLGSAVSLSNYQYMALTNGNPLNVPVSGISVSPSGANIKIGATQQLNAAIFPSDATNKNLTWASGNTGIATVNGSGMVTAVASGTVTITVTTQDGAKTASSVINVLSGNSFTVHFSKPATYVAGPYIYWWGALPSGVLADATWPGSAMVSNGNGWYSYTFTNISSVNLIFNDGGKNQTGNLSRSNDGWYLNDAWYDNAPTTTGIKQASGSEVTVVLFPSPVYGKQFYVAMEKSGSIKPFCQIIIADLSGRIILETAPGEDGLIEQSLPSGLYFVTIKGEGFIRTQKLVIE